MVLLLTACGKQAAEEPATQPGQSTTLATDALDEGELPQVTLPQQTQPVTDVTEETEPTESAKPTEGTEPSQPTQPPNTSVPTEPTGPPFDEDELPPIPVW